jgi:hypothetical protein
MYKHFMFSRRDSTVSRYVLRGKGKAIPVTGHEGP